MIFLIRKIGRFSQNTSSYHSGCKVLMSQLNKCCKRILAIEYNYACKKMLSSFFVKSMLVAVLVKNSKEKLEGKYDRRNVVIF